ncbi:hypothetical protein [Corynebacterium sp.]|uniref:hypothetical protein n=1 Tax=Corynebacterium sp. TaxID=1720 RepID=UPI0028ADB47A|nr:hypothetical protein [Corynebacterium sp.]
MSLKIESVAGEIETYEIPAGDTTVTLTVPTWDCQKLSDLEALNARAEKEELPMGNTEWFRMALTYFNPNEVDHINELVTRQLMLIGNDWFTSGEDGGVAGEDSTSSSDSSESDQS